ncbi:hypothetical protein P0D72_07705 [Paraburkholderia sediminicola]|uniref:hypothetical protein n=1 Tax=Paraburkholderia sediminicola TaxID=458836 RepID=UPI0038B96C74
MPNSTKEHNPGSPKSEEKIDHTDPDPVPASDAPATGGPTKIQTDEDGELQDEDAPE